MTTKKNDKGMMMKLLATGVVIISLTTGALAQAGGHDNDSGAKAGVAAQRNATSAPAPSSVGKGTRLEPVGPPPTPLGFGGPSDRIDFSGVFTLVAPDGGRANINDHDGSGRSGGGPMDGAKEINHGVDKPDKNTPGGRDVSGTV